MKLQTVLAISVVLAGLHLCSGSQTKDCRSYIMCSDVLDPVCGRNTDGFVETFRNECEMDVQNCERNKDFKTLFNVECLDALAAILDVWK